MSFAQLPKKVLGEFVWPCFVLEEQVRLSIICQVTRDFHKKSLSDLEKDVLKRIDFQCVKASSKELKDEMDVRKRAQGCSCWADSKTLLHSDQCQCAYSRYVPIIKSQTDVTYTIHNSGCSCLARNPNRTPMNLGEHVIISGICNPGTYMTMIPRKLSDHNQFLHLLQIIRTKMIPGAKRYKSKEDRKAYAKHAIEWLQSKHLYKAVFQTKLLDRYLVVSKRKHTDTLV